MLKFSHVQCKYFQQTNKTSSRPSLAARSPMSSKPLSTRREKYYFSRVPLSNTSPKLYGCSVADHDQFLLLFDIVLFESETVQVRGRGNYNHSPPECLSWQRRAPTLTPPPPRTMEQPHPSLLHQSEFHSGSPLRTTISAGAWSRRQPLSTRMLEAETSTVPAP